MPPRARFTIDRLRKNAPSPLGGPIFFLAMQGIEAPIEASLGRLAQRPVSSRYC